MSHAFEARYVRSVVGSAVMSKSMIIKTVDQLITALGAVGAGAPQLEVMRGMQVPLKEFERSVKWDPRHYTRTCITRNRYFELLLVGFEPGQSTSIHDYDGHEAWIHPLDGELTEERFELDADGRLQLISSVVLGPRSFSYLSNAHSIHRFVNTGTGRCMSLNLYCGPIRKWRVYDPHTGRSSTVGAPIP